ncbi:hypothetical protein PBV52_50820 [Streptomyces sp. T12]|uniref:hypothetical protein n=1 Tax=Streptomyces sp. T12 TaxID=477697 RepID=UPI002366B90D|nr:hypothetical protein [Streptomyces sp. T12]WDF44487.1 hypothetical protein PBV52_50820 [Streptomyces sp. T12]
MPAIAALAAGAVSPLATLLIVASSVCRSPANDETQHRVAGDSMRGELCLLGCIFVDNRDHSDGNPSRMMESPCLAHYEGRHQCLLIQQSSAGRVTTDWLNAMIQYFLEDDRVVHCAGIK